jgi:hypothetical protein
LPCRNKDPFATKHDPPHGASGAQEILERHQRLSKPSGTRVNIKGGTGIVRL